MTDFVAKAHVFISAAFTKPGDKPSPIFCVDVAGKGVKHTPLCRFVQKHLEDVGNEWAGWSKALETMHVLLAREKVLLTREKARRAYWKGVARAMAKRLRFRQARIRDLARDLAEAYS